MREHRAGREEGEKDRPCAVVLAIEDDDGEPRVTVVPITHTQPSDPSTVVELPQPTKLRLGLDHQRSWIVLSEANEFVWPGPDLRPVPGNEPSTVAYGFLPPGLLRIVLDRFVALALERRAMRVQRTE